MKLSGCLRNQLLTLKCLLTPTLCLEDSLNVVRKLEPQAQHNYIWVTVSWKMHLFPRIYHALEDLMCSHLYLAQPMLLFVLVTGTASAFACPCSVASACACSRLLSKISAT